MMNSHSWLSIFICLFALEAFAQKKPVYGPEFTFYVGETEGYFPAAEVSKIAKMLRDTCKVCEMHSDSGSGQNYRFTAYLNGKSFEFVVSGDPQVIEIQVEPMTLQQWQDVASHFETEIFNRIRKQFKPHVWNGAGHLNIGLESFENVRHLRNFITFFFNHPELAFVLGQADYDFMFARHILQTQLQTRLQMADVLQFINPDPTKSDWDNRIDFLKALQGVYVDRDSTDNLEALPNEFRGRTFLEKFNALAFEKLYMRHLARIEIRTVRPQQSIHQWVSQLKLIESIIEYTRSHSEIFDPNRAYPKMSTAHLTNFKTLLERLNLNPSDYTGLLKKNWLKSWSNVTSNTSVNQCLNLFR